MARRIIRTSGYTRPSRTVVRRKDGKLTARQKWLNSLGKDGMFEWDVAIKYEDGRRVQKTMKYAEFAMRPPMRLAMKWQ